MLAGPAGAEFLHGGEKSVEIAAVSSVQSASLCLNFVPKRGPVGLVGQVGRVNTLFLPGPRDPRDLPDLQGL